MGDGFAALMAAILAGVWAITFTNLAVNDSWEDDLVKRGLAIHCPNDGRWAWKGECK